MMALVLTQAMAEYVGTLVAGMPGAFRSAASFVAAQFTEHTAEILGVLLAILLLWSLVSRRRPR